jgi:hypothetical protein
MPNLPPNGTAQPQGGQRELLYAKSASPRRGGLGGRVCRSEEVEEEGVGASQIPVVARRNAVEKKGVKRERGFVHFQRLSPCRNDSKL